ncbi:zinc finger protein 678-like [Aricia agestis]|uniref:zinc finger protein 678-like n=1 Tax=Aricia agestis TaxID=91739 RepID=UPI001C20862C|nr:zinc finger protein 678-like [Aricia agestis]
MSNKLVIHKIENEINFKSLQISLDQNKDGMHEQTEWVDGKIEEESRSEDADVVVKVLNSEERSTFDLDYCAREIKEGSILHILKDHFGRDCEKESNEEVIDKTKGSGGSGIEFWDQLQRHNTITGNKNNMDYEFKNFLEHSLIKVKENNHRIWQKIQILNKTLNIVTKNTFYLDGKSLHSYTCSECEKCFVYETGLRRHFYMRHGTIDWPQWQTVWTCMECFQVWPQYDYAIRHSKSCCSPSDIVIVREIKTSLLLQCEFCEKVFTCIPKLLRHCKDHTAKYNYECKDCCMIFVSYKNAEQHWMQCPWSKQNYTFSLPKMLLCNICDRKFRNYEQLYNHRYKAGHFMGKIIDKEDLLSIVYQCEACSQWFINTMLLKEHRNQHHPRFDCVIAL